MTAGLLERKELIQRYLEETPAPLSSFSFVNIFTWKKFFQFELETIDGNLCVFARHELGTFLYLPPLGKNVTPQTIQACFERMDRANPGKGVSRVENVPAHQLALFPRGEFSHYNKGWEYLYYRKDLVELVGNLYKSKRSSYNQFVKNYRFQYLPYEDAMLNDCAALYGEWARGRWSGYVGNAAALQMLEENAGVHQLALRHCKELGLTGRVVMVDGKIRAYTFGYPLNKDIFCVLFEVVDLSFKGLGVFIFREFCRDAAAPYKFINVMDDFELENVRRTKMSFQPAVMFASYVVSRAAPHSYSRHPSPRGESLPLRANGGRP